MLLNGGGRGASSTRVSDDFWTVGRLRSSFLLVGEGFEGEGNVIKRIEDEVVSGHAKGVERVVRRRGTKFILFVEGKV